MTRLPLPLKAEQKLGHFQAKLKELRSEYDSYKQETAAKLTEKETLVKTGEEERLRAKKVFLTWTFRSFRTSSQGCGVGGKISDSNSDFPKFPTPDSDSGLSKISDSDSLT